MIDHRLYRRFRAAGMQATHAAHAARTLATFTALEDAGFVRVDAQSDSDPDLSWLDQDHYFADRQGRALRALNMRSIERDGVWGTLGQYHTSPESDEWESADSVWGHIGYRNVTSPFENWYVIDVMAQTIDNFKRALSKRFCPKCGKRIVV